MLPSHRQTGEYFTIGILGGGQLAKMLLQAATKLGFNGAVYEQFPNSPAGKTTQWEFVGSWNDTEKLKNFAAICDVVTIESEFVPVESLRFLQTLTSVLPPPETLAKVQDKLQQKKIVRRLQFPAPEFQEVDSIESAREFGKRVGYPFFLKSRFMGYDGYGNVMVHSENDIAPAFERLLQRQHTHSVLAEAFIQFRKEIALLLTRSGTGEVVFYPLVETIQKESICHLVLAPFHLPHSTTAMLQSFAKRLAEEISLIGTMAIEFFLIDESTILFNEIAPRVHNSGHFTIEACFTSQFENHIRAISNLPLGSTDMRFPAAAMINILGDTDGAPFIRTASALLQSPYISVHYYGKAHVRRKRKMGHITATGNSIEEARTRVEKARAEIQW